MTKILSVPKKMYTSHFVRKVFFFYLPQYSWKLFKNVSNWRNMMNKLRNQEFYWFFKTCRNRKYTSRPRMSGTPGGYELVQILLEAWRSSGIDDVRVTPYDVLMSYPNRTNPNRVCIWKPSFLFSPKRQPEAKQKLNLLSSF